MTSSKVYALTLSDEQLSRIKSLFGQNNWVLEIESIDRYLEKSEIAGDYVALNTKNNRASPTGKVNTVSLCVF